MEGCLKVAMLGAGALALAAMSGCAKSGQSAAANAAAAPTTAAAAIPAPAPGSASPTDKSWPIKLSELPSPPAGEWVLVSTQNAVATSVSRVCLDGKPIDPNRGMAKPCEKLDAVRFADGGFKVTGACSSNGVTSALLMRGVGDFKTSFYTDTELRAGPDTATTINSKYSYAGPTCAK